MPDIIIDYSVTYNESRFLVYDKVFNLGFLNKNASTNLP